MPLKLLSQNTSLVYDLILDSEQIGTLTTTKTQQGNGTIYTAQSKVVIHLLGETTIATTMNATYTKGVFASSSYTALKDWKPYENTTITSKEGTYSVKTNVKETTIDKPITTSTVELYFSEPKGIEEILSELEGVFKTIDSIDAYTYQLKDRDGNINNTYIYKNGILEEGEEQHTLYRLKLKLRFQ